MTGAGLNSNVFGVTFGLLNVYSFFRRTSPLFRTCMLAVPDFSVREQRPYLVPDYISRLARYGSCIAAKIGDRRRSLSPSFRKSGPQDSKTR